MEMLVIVIIIIYNVFSLICVYLDLYEINGQPKLLDSLNQCYQLDFDLF